MNKYLNELDAKRFLSSYGVPMAKSRKAADKEELLKVLEEMEFPIAMKVLSSDRGGMRIPWSKKGRSRRSI